MLQFVQCGVHPKPRQRRICNEAFVQQEITMCQLLFKTLELYINTFALCHLVLLKTPCKRQNMTFRQMTVLPKSISHAQVVVLSHIPVFLRCGSSQLRCHVFEMSAVGFAQKVGPGYCSGSL